MPAAQCRSSRRKKAANRSNARKSTGPRSDAGKERSSRNALTHGLYVESAAVGEDECVVFAAHGTSLITDLNPRDVAEYTQVQRIASLQWRIDRIQQAEAALIENERFATFDANAERIGLLEEAVAEDQQDPPDRRSIAPAECARIAAARAGHADAEGIPPAYALMSLVGGDGSAALERLSRLEQRLDTQLQRAWKCLKDLKDPKREIDAPPSPLIEAMNRHAIAHCLAEQGTTERCMIEPCETGQVEPEQNRPEQSQTGRCAAGHVPATSDPVAAEVGAAGAGTAQHAGRNEATVNATLEDATDCATKCEPVSTRVCTEVLLETPGSAQPGNWRNANDANGAMAREGDGKSGA